MSDLIHFLVTYQPHFVNHLAPIYQALPDDLRGSFFTRSGSPAEKRARSFGITPVRQRLYKPDETVVVASYEDYQASRKARVVFYNHGVGQTYPGDRRSARLSSYSGGKGRDRTTLFLCPSQRDVEANLAAYPDIPAAPIGVPYLDRFSNLNYSPDAPVGISFHANIGACSETRWAWPWIKDQVAVLAVHTDLPILGHCHPRARRLLEPWWDHLGVAFEADWLKVIPQISCYVIDNSSSGYEAAAVGIPVVWLNPPYYRREVHHGLRFWDLIPGDQVDDPEDLHSAINQARQRGVSVDARAYAGPDGTSLVDGRATERAVSWLTRALSTSPTTSSTTS